jgi:hypothetical protein
MNSFAQSALKSLQISKQTKRHFKIQTRETSRLNKKKELSRIWSNNNMNILRIMLRSIILLLEVLFKVPVFNKRGSSRRIGKCNNRMLSFNSNSFLRLEESKVKSNSVR